MKNKPNNPHAFPILEQNTYHGESKLECTNAGMTLRDYFAAKAMEHLISVVGKTKDGFIDYGLCARSAYFIADAMLKEREREDE